MENKIKIFYLKDSKEFRDYELLDTGEGEKLERFGPYTFVRPLENALWSKTLDKKEWDKADGRFASSKKGEKPGWKMKSEIREKWDMEYMGIRFSASPTPFRHLGFFPEEASKWDFIENQIKDQIKSSGRKIKFLNLFGYTGVSSLFALRAGAEVTHVDASKAILKWTKENQDTSKMNDLPMRIIEDDAIKFLEREIKRGNTYDAIIMDPPKFGRGPGGEIWKIEEKLPRLLELAKKALSDKPLFVILTSYAIEASSLTLGYALGEVMGENVESGELCVMEKSKGRLIPLANTAVWRAN